MSLCVGRRPLVWLLVEVPLGGALLVGALLVGALLASGCGKDGAAPGSGEPGPRAAEAVFLPDTAPWPSAAAGEAWELAAWMPQGPRVEGRRVDPAFLRVNGAMLHTQGVWFETVEAWRRWVRELKLPEDGFSDVIVVSEPIDFYAYLPRIKEAEIVSRLLAQGFIDKPQHGSRFFFAPGAESPIAAFIDGRLVLGTGEATVLERVIALRAGREPSARALPGVEAALAAVGPGLPVELEASEAGLKNGPPGAPLVIASAGRLLASKDPGEVRALALRSEAEVAAMRSTLETLLAGVPVNASDRPRVASRGPVLRLTSPAGLGRVGRSHDGGIHNDLGSLTRALERYRSERGALPSASAGLAALSSVPGCLDEFMGALPVDPWGHPYAYQPEHPKRPGGFVLRSIGPDGEIDTEDDVLAEE